MRALAYVVTMLAVLSGPATAAPRSTTIGGVRIDIEAKLPVMLVDEPTGAVVRAPNMPPIWFSAYGESCPSTDRPLDLPRPPGFHVAARPPAVSPWPQRMSWDALCVEGDDVTLHVLIQYFDPVTDPAANAYVQDVLRSLLTSIRPPLEIVPKVRFERTEWGPLLRRGPAANQFLFEGKLLEISLDRTSCRNLAVPPPAPLPQCRELPDRALVVGYRDMPRPAGESPPPGEPPPPTEPPPPAEPPPLPSPPAAPPPLPEPPPPGEPPPDSTIKPTVPPPQIDDLVQEIVRAVEIVYGTASWLPDTPFHPSWGNGALPLSKLPPGTWKISGRDTRFELFEIESRSRIVVSQASCSGFWASPPAGHRIEAPSFLPRGTRAAVVDERERWIAASCFPVLGVDAAVTIDLPRAPDQITARALATALAEAVDAPRFVYSIAGAAETGSLGLLFDGWFVGMPSILGQFEVMRPRTDEEGQLASFRLAGGVGAGFSRPRFRAAAHIGIGIEQAPLKQRDGEDHTGGSVFLDSRALAGVGPFVVQGIARVTAYFDMDCTESHDKDQLCGESDSSDHTPQLGWELEGRAGITTRYKGWMVSGYLGVRYLAVKAEDRVEHAALGTLGILVW